ncbi:MAG: hypothetical protein FWG80_01270 [Alphaproteobacteria bacterium]|nr:hypothetical protein [Alphaproteobacteria bacterium]
MKLNCPRKVLSYIDCGDAYEITYIDGTSTGTIRFNKTEFLKQNPAVRKNMYIAPCGWGWSCATTGRWCKKVENLAERDVPDKLQSRYVPFPWLVKCNRQFYKMIKNR